MTLPEEGQLLRIIIGESDKYGKQPLYEWIVRKAREFGLAGATVYRGLEGFGAHSRVHTAKILRLSSDLPIVIEIVDTSEKIEQFMPIIDDAITEGLATLEKATIRFADLVTRGATAIDEEILEWLGGYYSEDEIVELTLVISLANMVNRINDSLQIETDLE